jgi:hypothetical protein
LKRTLQAKTKEDDSVCDTVPGLAEAAAEIALLAAARAALPPPSTFLQNSPIKN